ncbi:MAG: hypothetical protein ACTSWL_01805 [Promethearchaeota archaeon]
MHSIMKQFYSINIKPDNIMANPITDLQITLKNGKVIFGIVMPEEMKYPLNRHNAEIKIGSDLGLREFTTSSVSSSIQDFSATASKLAKDIDGQKSSLSKSFTKAYNRHKQNQKIKKQKTKLSYGKGVKFPKSQWYSKQLCENAHMEMREANLRKSFIQQYTAHVADCLQPHLANNNSISYHIENLKNYQPSGLFMDEKNLWLRGQFEHYLTEIGHKNGFNVFSTPAFYTSKKCSNCHNLAKKSYLIKVLRKNYFYESLTPTQKQQIKNIWTNNKPTLQNQFTELESIIDKLDVDDIIAKLVSYILLFFAIPTGIGEPVAHIIVPILKPILSELLKIINNEAKKPKKPIISDDIKIMIVDTFKTITEKFPIDQSNLDPAVFVQVLDEALYFLAIEGKDLLIKIGEKMKKSVKKDMDSLPINFKELKVKGNNLSDKLGEIKDRLSEKSPKEPLKSNQDQTSKSDITSPESSSQSPKEKTETDVKFPSDFNIGQILPAIFDEKILEDLSLDDLELEWFAGDEPDDFWTWDQMLSSLTSFGKRKWIKYEKGSLTITDLRKIKWILYDLNKELKKFPREYIIALSLGEKILQHNQEKFQKDGYMIKDHKILLSFMENIIKEINKFPIPEMIENYNKIHHKWIPINKFTGYLVYPRGAGNLVACQTCGIIGRDKNAA